MSASGLKKNIPSRATNVKAKAKRGMIDNQPRKEHGKNYCAFKRGLQGKA